MKRNNRYGAVLKLISEFFIVFLLVAFVITCCTMLFVTVLGLSLEMDFSEEQIAGAAKVTFLNVLFLSFIFTVLDFVRRRLTVDRPIRKIKEAAQQLVKGDFSVRVPASRNEELDEVIDCFNTMAEELSGIDTLRNDFVANVSHELKTPLTVLQNYGTLLQQPGLPEAERLEYATAITASSRQLAELVTNILKLNKLENQQIYPTRKEFDLTEQLCGCLLQFESIWEQENIAIETELEENVTVFADEELLLLVWNNLLSNAFKFTPAGGTVKVSLKATDHHATVTVEDTGCGMSPEVGARIFEKFYQGDSSHSARGNGLGLALVKRVVDILRGEIRVESRQGEGSTFSVILRRNLRG